MIKKSTRIEVEVNTERGKYRDALYYDEGEEPTDEECEAIVQERADNWVEMLNNPPEEVELTVEELQKQQEEYIRQTDELTAKIIEIGSAIEKARMKEAVMPQLDEISSKLAEI